MGGLNNLQQLCITDASDAHCIRDKRAQLVVNCEKDSKGIQQMLTDGKKKYDGKKAIGN